MIDRRTMIAGTLAAAAIGRARAETAVSRITAYAFSFPALSEGEIRLADYSGRPLIVVNTASLCGYTPQDAGLQQLWTEFRDRGLGVIGVPPTISADRNRAALPTLPRPPSINMQLPSRSRQRPSLSGPMHIPSTNGPPKHGPRIFHAGTFTNT